MGTREEIVRGRVLHPLVARVDVTNAMATQRTREVDGTTGGIETETRDMSIGREIGGMGRERTLLTDNTRGDFGLEHQMSVKTEDSSKDPAARSDARIVWVQLFLCFLTHCYFLLNFRIVYILAV